MELLIETLRFIAPAYVANPVPVLLGGGTPVDLGHNFWDGKRIFGDGKTWRGLVAGITAGTIVGFVQGRLLPGFLLGLGAMGGDLAGSFVKRRLGVARGSPTPGVDQLDFLVGALLLVSLVEPPT
ncbi:MAG: CDP-2,3-bis-(O-geranylgeranyl)-sn-glycerol synthase, partial [Methanobacteriota archaeon]